MEVSEVCKVVDFKEHHRNTHAEGGHEGNGSEDEDEEHGGQGGQRVRCAQ